MSQTTLPAADTLPASAESGEPSGVRGTKSFELSDQLDVISDPSGIRAESIRVLRTQLESRHLRDGRRSLAICAPAPGAGCTYLATNLAVAMAQAGIKTLLIDGNLREAGVERYIVPSEPVVGLVDVLSEPTLPLSQAIEHDVIPGLSVLFAGREAVAKQELLGGPAFKGLIDSCLRDYDLTIIDTPAANGYADARRIASVLRYALVVSCRNRSYVRDVKTLIGELQSNRVQVVGTYLNDY